MFPANEEKKTRLRANKVKGERKIERGKEFQTHMRVGGGVRMTLEKRYTKTPKTNKCDGEDPWFSAGMSTKRLVCKTNSN